MKPKLRAWDKEDEQMSYGEIEHFDDMIGYRFDHFCTGADEGVEFMQFTGLIDKNGAEVYEGDIVKCSRGCPHIIYWEKEIGGIYLGGMPGWYLSGLREGYAWTGTEEIIGNIHENPKLLEDTKND